MERPLYELDELPDVVQGKSRFEITEIPGNDFETPPLRGRPTALQPASQSIIDDLTKREASAARFRLQLGSHIIIQRDSRSHIMMLSSRHHDVNARGQASRYGQAVCHFCLAR